MDDTTRTDIRQLLKQFGITADEAIMDYLDQVPGGPPLRLRITLEDITDYGEEDAPQDWLYVDVEGTVRR